MHTLLTRVLFIISTLFSFSSFAQSSDTTITQLINEVDNHQVVNVGISRSANANSGAIQIKVTKITKSTIINRIENRKILNVSSGSQATGNVGALGIY